MWIGFWYGTSNYTCHCCRSFGWLFRSCSMLYWTISSCRSCSWLSRFCCSVGLVAGCIGLVACYEGLVAVVCPEAGCVSMVTCCTGLKAVVGVIGWICLVTGLRLIAGCPGLVVGSRGKVEWHSKSGTSLSASSNASLCCISKRGTTPAVSTVLCNILPSDTYLCLPRQIPNLLQTTDMFGLWFSSWWWGSCFGRNWITDGSNSFRDVQTHNSTYSVTQMWPITSQKYAHSWLLKFLNTSTSKLRISNVV